MFARTLHPDDLARLKLARESADEAYNAALTALDRTLARGGELPHPPPGPDEHQITPLNEGWPILPETPPIGGNWLTRRLRALVWAIVAPIFERQQAFNSALVDHVNRSVPVDRATRTAIEATLLHCGERLRVLEAFNAALMAYLQRLTPYVDAKDHELEALATRRIEDARDLLDHLDHRTMGLNGAIAGLSDELLKRWESMVARERRYEAAVTALTEAHTSTAQEFRDAIGVLHQSTLTLKRELERLGSTPGNPSTPSTPSTPGTMSTSGTMGTPSTPGTMGTSESPLSTSGPPGTMSTSDTSAALNSWKYVGFEDRFRGSQEEIGARLEAYVPLFANASDVLDVGCGRGEFLDLLKTHGITARGLDLNHEMVEVCRTRGLEAHEGDALSYLRSLPDASLGGLIAAQVVEHLEPDYLLQVLEEAYHKLRPSAVIVLETINAACWFAFFSSYIRDITHVRPLHPDTLGYLLTASGFQQVTIRYSAPYPEDDKLKKAPGDGLVEEAVNANVDKLNSLLFTHLDYAAIGTKR